MRRGRQILISTHKWLGLFAAVFLLLQAVSGTILVYRAELVAYFSNAPGAHHDASGDVLSRALAASHSHYPNYSLTRVDFPAARTGVYLLHLQHRQSGAVTHAVMDPATTALSEPFVAKLMAWLFAWHHELFAGQTGTWLVGILGLLLVTGTVTGLVIWWPGWRRLGWGLRVGIAGPAARNLYEWHRTLGVVISAILLLLAVSGTVMAFGPLLRPALGVTSDIPSLDGGESAATALPPDQLLAIAQRRFPSSQVRDARFQQPGDLLRRVILHRAGDAGARPPHQVWLDSYRGEVQISTDSRELAANDAFFAWMYPLHTRLGSNGPGRVLGVLSGLALSGLVLLGVLLWAKRRALRQSRRRDAVSRCVAR